MWSIAFFISILRLQQNTWHISVFNFVQFNWWFVALSHTSTFNGSINNLVRNESPTPSVNVYCVHHMEILSFDLLYQLLGNDFHLALLLCDRWTLSSIFHKVLKSHTKKRNHHKLCVTNAHKHTHTLLQCIRKVMIFVCDQLKQFFFLSLVSK